MPLSTTDIAFSGIDLSTYVRVGRYDLPEPTRTAAPANSLLAQEVSAVTYNWDTGTLFVVGDGGTSVVQVSKTGQLINSMTLAPGGSPQGTDFYDPEGLTYLGGGQFVMAEERDRQAVLFTYAAGGTLTRSDAQTVKLGTFVQNIGIEGISYDPLSGGYIAVKETQPEGIFQTDIDFAAGTATNGSPATENSTNLFDPALANLADFADVFALSNLPYLSGQADFSHLLVLSQESGRIVNIDRAGNIYSSLTIVSDPGNPLSVPAQQHEGLTMDRDGFLYVVSENGGGDFDHPQLWVYAPSAVPNQAPTSIVLNNQVNAIVENTGTVTRIKVADLTITDDGIGTNNLTVTGADAGFFEVDSNGLYIKSGTTLDFETKASYNVTVNVDDTTVGGTPDAAATFSLAVTNVVNEDPAHPSLFISEVAPWSSGNSPAALAADWFEVTNTGNSAVDITGWKMDDNSNSFAVAVTLNGITSIAPGESVIFIETNDLAGKTAAFLSTWFGASPPAGLHIGSYSGGGVGLSTGGDAVNLYNSSGVLQANVTFGTSPAGAPFATFSNPAGLNNTAISQLSATGVNGGFVAASDTNEIGSPGTAGKVFISEVAPWSSGNSPVGADWFEVTNGTAFAVDITGWKMDDNSGSPAAAVALNGITSIAAGESVIFIETNDLPGKTAAFLSNWFGGNPPAGLHIGSYNGSGVGLSTGGDAVNLYNSGGVLQASVAFGASPSGTFATFDNAAGLNNATISLLSAAGVNGGFVAVQDAHEIGSPGEITPVNHPPVAVDDSLSSIAEDSGNRTISFASLTGNDSTGPANESSQSLTIISVGNTVGGTVSIVGTDVIFAPAHDFSGAAGFEYTVRDNGITNGVAHFLSDVGAVSFAITEVNDAPVFKSPAGFTVAENLTAVGTVAAFDPDNAFTFALAGSDDQSFFSIDPLTGALSFPNTPDFETPEDANHDNTYDVVVSATDAAGAVSTQTLSVHITNVNETGQTIIGGNSDDALTGSSGPDMISGGNGNDTITGGDGNDVLNGGTGADAMDGGRGNDAYFVDNAGDGVIETAGNGIDTVYTTLAGYTLGANVENLYSSGAVAFAGTGNALDNTIGGGAGNDVLSGLGGADALYGLGGNDTLLGGDGNDALDGGSGADVMDGGAGNDAYLVDDAADVVVEAAGGGIDTVRTTLSSYTLADEVENLVSTGSGAFTGTGNVLDNAISGGAGNDVLSGLGGNDVIYGLGGNDTLSGGDGNDALYGGTGDDTLAGGDGNDALDGGAGNDVLAGLAGDDTLRGLDGNDTLVGGAGIDALLGGLGADVFKFDALSDTGLTPATADRVLDFSHLELDRIDLSGIDADSALDGEQAFAFVGTDAFTHQAGELRYEVSGTTSTVYGDVDGDGAADFAIQVVGVTNLVAADFAL